MKVKKDRIFVIVLGLVLANLVYWFAGYLSVITTNWASAYYWVVLLADLLAIVGTLWLLRTYRRGRKIVRDEQRKAQEEQDN